MQKRLVRPTSVPASTPPFTDLTTTNRSPRLSMSTSVPNLSKGNNSPQSPFVPPSGGDITLRSSGGVDFLVHSTHLKLASSVFADMIASGATKDTIHLSEDGIGISYLLRFIYPNRFPLTISPDVLPVCLTIVQKYDVGGALEIIDGLIVLDTPPHKFLSSDPIRAYQLASQFGLSETRTAAARFITADKVDFCDLDKVSELAQTYSSRRLVYLMNVQAMRAKLLSDVLLRFEKVPIQPTESDPDLYWGLSCVSCRRGNREVLNKVPPSWVLAWAQLVYEILLVSSEPLTKLDHLFQSSTLEKFKGKNNVCQVCLLDFETIRSQQARFDRWAQKIKKTLEEQLAKLEAVYAL